MFLKTGVPKYCKIFKNWFFYKTSLVVTSVDKIEELTLIRVGFLAVPFAPG